MFEQSVRRPERINSVVAVVVGGEIRAPKTPHTGPKETVESVIPRGHVFDRDTVAADHDPGAEFELAVENHGISIHTAQRDARRGDEYRLAVFPFVYQPQS